MLLKDIIEFKNGKKKPSSKGNVPIYGGNGILDYTDQNNQDGESLIIGRVGAYCGCVYSHYGKCWISDNAIVGKVKEGNDFYYCYNLLKKLNLNSRHIGSGQPLMTQEILNNIEVNPCDYEIQKKIGRILKNIDDKIENNNKINNNLYDLQKCYYKELFKDKTYQELKLDDLFIISAGGDAPKDKQQSANDEYKYPIVANGIDNDGIYGYSKEYRINRKSVTISARGTIGYKVLRNYNYYPIVRLVSLIPKNDSISSEYLFFALDDVQILGTGTTQQQLTVPMVKDIKIKVYEKELIRKFTDYSISLNKKIDNNKLENKNLEQLRDTLLPRLMNGEIDLDNIEI